MITPQRIGQAALAAGFAVFVLTHAADARGGGHGSMRGRTAGTMATPLAVPAATQGPSTTAAKQPATTQAISPSLAAATAAATAVTQTPTTTTGTALPPSAIAAPAPQATPIAPLSPGPDPVVLSGGGPARTDTVPSAASGSSSPSESAPSTPGGGADTFEACVGFWDAQTHMSKAEWRTACRRIQSRFASLKH